MIQRRVYEHVRTHNWFAVAIDLLVVIIGVFIGIQVANWNAAQIDDKRSYQYLERIRGDLDADLANYKNRLAFWRQVRNYGGQALAYAETGDPHGLTQWQLLLAYFQASQLAEFYTTESTYEELKSAGELGLIADIRLRDSLAAYYTVGTRDPVFTERPEYRRRVRGIIPLEIQDYIWANCWSSSSSLRQTFKDCPAPVADAVSVGIVDSLRRDSVLMVDLRFWMSTMNVASRDAQAKVADAEQLRESVVAALGASR